MNRRGQIFLLLTVLVLTFIIGISTILIEVKRAQYYDPSTDSDRLFEIWDNAVDAVQQIYSVQIAINTQGPGVGGVYNAEIDAELVRLETYLNTRGFAASITRTIDADYKEDAASDPVEARMDSSVLIIISSSTGITIEQVLTINIVYTAFQNNNIVTITKSVNGVTIYLQGSTVTPTSGGTIVQDFGNGSFELSGAGTYDCLTPDQVLLPLSY